MDMIDIILVSYIAGLFTATGIATYIIWRTYE